VLQKEIYPYGCHLYSKMNTHFLLIFRMTEDMCICILGKEWNSKQEIYPLEYSLYLRKIV
jgi:hypothetical protein